ncbi:MAG: carbohydrate binding family 9 domain-containing protein [Acidobacteria bacterium]|nr:carbohydrate binding family 9 domain-containing protein [Acidobacteriota bacterium]
MRSPRAAMAGLVLLAIAAAFSAEVEASFDQLSSPEPPAVGPAGKPPRPTYRVPRASGAIVIDGKLDEEAWERAVHLDLRYEVNPGDNLPAGAKTDAFLTYDASHFYAAFYAHDPDPRKIHAHLSDRDLAFRDDFVGLVLDTFNDERRAFEFFVNPVGVQMDLVQDDISGNEDSSWDAIWTSAGRVTDDGYIVEMSIPYNSLRFQNSAGDQTWGVDFVRIFPRDRRYQFTLNPRDKSTSCYLCQIAKIVGFAGATPGANIQITPTLTAIRSDDDPNFPLDFDPNYRGLRNVRSGPHYDLGLTAKWGITPNLTATGTLNPDFSQVEADTAQLNVNEAFALYFPEKRPFFLEGSDYFDTPFQAVYSRNVADPSWGAKVTGKLGKSVVGFFAAEDARTNLLFPGSQGSITDTLVAPTTDAVLRYRLDAGSSSSIGALVTSREGDGYSNRVAGVDSLLRPTKSDSIRMQLLASQTEYPDAVAARDAQPVDPFGDHAFRLQYDHNTKSFSAWARSIDIGPGFRADMGFVPQVDYREELAGAERTWWGKPGAFFSRILSGAESSWRDDQSGRLLQNRTAGWVSLQGPHQSFVFLGAGHRVSGFRDNEFDQGFVDFDFNMEATRAVFFGVSGGADAHVDFAFADPNDAGAARQGHQFRVAPNARYNVGRHVRFDLSHEYRRLENDDGHLFIANLTQLTTAYQVTVRMFFRAILQYEGTKHNLALYGLQCPGGIPGGANCPFQPRERNLFSQLLFSYKINPQTAFFLGYSDNRSGLETGPPNAPIEIPLTRTSRTFFFKLGYAWVI